MIKQILKNSLILLALITVSASNVTAQIISEGVSVEENSDSILIRQWLDAIEPQSIFQPDSVWTEGVNGDSVLTRVVTPIPDGYYVEPVFDGWHLLDTLNLTTKKREPFAQNAFLWIDDISRGTLILNRARQEYIVNNPDKIRYNIEFLPTRPDEYNTTVDAVAERIELKESIVNVNSSGVAELAPGIDQLRWLQDFNASVQFSQAYISPNWYQGGNNSLIMLVNALYNVKLNQKFYPKLLFETTIGYKLGVNTVPDDSIHNYSVSEDLFQINSTFGYKAAKRWYYSVNLQFKTQFLNSYNSNSTTLRSAFLSPAELNIGAGMTYDYANPKNTFTFKASIDPISWQLKTCTNSRINQTAFDIPEGKKWTNKSGSSMGYVMMWKLSYNIIYNSRLFLFTDYKLFQADWEHKLAFNVNKYLSTNIYINMRYDTDTPTIEGSKWRKFQMKEILSFGFSYTFSNTRP